MRAVVLTAPATPVEVADVDLADPQTGEGGVRITAAGVCHSALHLVRGWEVPTPCVPGREGAGVVTAVGPHVTGLTGGDHVVLPWNPYCGTCPTFPAGRETWCHAIATVVNTSGGLHDGTSWLLLHGAPLHHDLGFCAWAGRGRDPGQWPHQGPQGHASRRGRAGRLRCGERRRCRRPPRQGEGRVDGRGDRLTDERKANDERIQRLRPVERMAVSGAVTAAAKWWRPDAFRYRRRADGPRLRHQACRWLPSSVCDTACRGRRLLAIRRTL